MDSTGSPVPEIEMTSSNAEDSGVAAGWSIHDYMRFRSNTSTRGWGSVANTNIPQFAIQGSAKTNTGGPPKVVAGSTSGSLEVSWEAPNKDGGSAVTDYDLRYYQGSADLSNPADWIEEGEPWRWRCRARWRRARRRR